MKVALHFYFFFFPSKQFGTIWLGFIWLVEGNVSLVEGILWWIIRAETALE